MTLFRLAHHLHKTVHEIEALGFDELSEWIAYFNIIDQEKA